MSQYIGVSFLLTITVRQSITSYDNIYLLSGFCW